MGKINVYVDGFNLYYGLYKNKRRKANLKKFKWLDLRSMAAHFCDAGDQIGDIYYCTADVSSPANDPDQSVRQQVFIQALQSHCGAIVVKGTFEVRTKKGIPIDTATHGQSIIEVSTFEEKGTDVNLATLLLRDAFTNNFDSAIVLSNDSDLALAIETCVQVARKPVKVVSPHLGVTHRLKAAATSNTVLTPKVVTSCQMPSGVTTADGSRISKPKRW